MARHPYELFSSRRLTRKLNSLEWLLQEVSIQTDSSFHDPHLEQKLASPVGVWATYAKGYPNGNIAPGSDTNRIVLVRYEDIRLRLQLVIEEIAALGIPRNATSFVAKESPTWKDGVRRRDILAGESGDSFYDCAHEARFFEAISKDMYHLVGASLVPSVSVTRI